MGGGTRGPKKKDTASQSPEEAEGSQRPCVRGDTTWKRLDQGPEKHTRRPRREREKNDVILIGCWTINQRAYCKRGWRIEQKQINHPHAKAKELGNRQGR